MFICLENYIPCSDLCVDEVYEMIATEVKGRDSKITREIVGIYRAPNEAMRLLERMANRTGYMRITTKLTVIGRDLNLPYADWIGQAEKSRETKIFLNRLVWKNGYTQVVNSPTLGMLRLTFTLSGPKVLSPLAVMVRGSVIIAGYYWK
jgi:hypothetical protein